MQWCQVRAKGLRRKALGALGEPEGHQGLVQSEQGRESQVMRSEKWGGVRSGKAKM